MNPTAIYSKTGKGVQEASGKTSFLSRGDRAILAAIDGKMSVQQLGAKFDRAGDDKFIAILRKMDADGFIREVSPGTVQRGAANAPRGRTGEAGDRHHQRVIAHADRAVAAAKAVEMRGCHCSSGPFRHYAIESLRVGDAATGACAGMSAAAFSSSQSATGIGWVAHRMFVSTSVVDP